jgi:hypothetical protein
MDRVMDVGTNRCGECSVCCEVLTFALAGALKPSGVMCPHCRAPSGCGIYQTREEVCRSYYCGWRHLDLPDEWRPDRSHFLISLRPGPDGSTPGVEFTLLGADSGLDWLPFLKFLAALADQATPVYLSLLGEPGWQSPWVHLNAIAVLIEGLKGRDLGRIKTGLGEALAICRAQPKRAIS